jgi:hypothetical protein
MDVKSLRFVFFSVLHMAALQVGAACTCAPRTAEQAFSQADIVFRGEIVAHRGDSAIFRVHEYWKGNLKDSVKLQWRRGDRGDCNGFWPEELKVGSELLVFATKGRHGVYRTSICLPTRPADSANKELHDLGPGKRVW